MIYKTKLMEIINDICDEIIKSENFLNKLDKNIGDGDHGSNMARGFKSVKDKNFDISNESISFILKSIAMTLISSIGGASGLLYGSSILKASELLEGKETIDKNDILRIGESIIANIKNRGKIEVGCKSMLDTIVPTFEAFKVNIEKDSDLKTLTEQIEKAAYEGMESTKTMMATYGRASFLDEESIGYIDAGAASSYIIIKTIIKAL